MISMENLQLHIYNKPLCDRSLGKIISTKNIAVTHIQWNSMKYNNLLHVSKIWNNINNKHFNLLTPYNHSSCSTIFFYIYENFDMHKGNRQVIYSVTCLIRHMKGPGKCVGLYKMSQYSCFYFS